MSFRFIYPREFAPALLERLSRAVVPEAFRRLSPLPSLGQAETLLDVAYAASLQQNEGRPVSLALAWVDRAQALTGALGVLPLAEPLPLTPETIRNVAPAVEPKRGYLLAGPTDAGGSVIWGLLHLHLSEEVRGSVPTLAVQVLRPGTLRIRHILDDLYLMSGGSCLELLGSNHAWRLLTMITCILDPAFRAETPSADAVSLLRLALGMLDQGHGGIILVAPKEAYGIVSRFRIEQPRTQLLRHAIANSGATGIDEAVLKGEHAWEANLSRQRQAGDRLFAVEEFVSHLTAVDGALHLAPDLELISFGAIVNAPELEPDTLIHVVDPLEEAKTRKSSLTGTELGTRHQAAMRFCFMNPGAMALVASQDGMLSFCTRVPGAEEVLVMRPYSLDVGALR